MAKLILDELTIKVIGGLIIAILIFTSTAVYMGQEIESESNFNKDKVQVENEDDLEKDGMWDRISQTGSNLIDGIKVMIKSLAGAPTIVLAILISVVPLVVAFVIARSFDVSI